MEYEVARGGAILLEGMRSETRLRERKVGREIDCHHRIFLLSGLFEIQKSQSHDHKGITNSYLLLRVTFQRKLPISNNNLPLHITI